MQKLTKQSIIETYNDLVREQGRVIGARTFTSETGISQYYWNGGYWRSWSAFQADAGHAPNSPTLKIDDEVVLNRFAELVLEHQAIPTISDMVLKKKEDPTFPDKRVFARWGNRDALLLKVAEYCKDKEQYGLVLKLLNQGISSSLSQRLNNSNIKGFVYLICSGKNYKIGRTNAVGRRLCELAIQLPEKPNIVHVIETDDPEGIENYWHRRFADRRKNGEWFTLQPEDIKAFKKRKFQ